MNNIDLEVLFSGMFSDELDRLGFRDQVISGLKLNNQHLHMLGQARTLQLETIETDDENIHAGLGFLEQLPAGSILCVEGSHEFAYFGELMTRLSLRQKLGGVVIGGLTRDARFTHSINTLPIFAEGYSPKDIKGRGRVKATDVPITINGITIEPGQWLFGDQDGIVVVPKEIEVQLFQAISRVIKEENSIKQRVEAGESVVEILTHHKAF